MPVTTQNENLKMLNDEMKKNNKPKKFLIKHYLYRPAKPRKSLGIKI
jgi:hypothetical protein